MHLRHVPGLCCKPVHQIFVEVSFNELQFKMVKAFPVWCEEILGDIINRAFWWNCDSQPPRTLFEVAPVVNSSPAGENMGRTCKNGMFFIRSRNMCSVACSSVNIGSAWLLQWNDEGWQYALSLHMTVALFQIPKPVRYPRCNLNQVARPSISGQRKGDFNLYMAGKGQISDRWSART